MKRVRVQPTYEQIAPNEWLIRIPAAYDGPVLPDQLIAMQVAFALKHDPEGTPPTPTPGCAGHPEPSGEERRRQHQERRRAALMRTSSSQRQFDAACDNEGLERSRWIDSGQAVQQKKRRLARERAATYRPYEG